MSENSATNVQPCASTKADRAAAGDNFLPNGFFHAPIRNRAIEEKTDEACKMVCQV
jgi:hypothetical protein